MKKSIRRGKFAVAAVTLLALLTGCADAGNDGEAEPIAKVNFGYITDFNGTSLLAVAKELGLWEKYNIDARYFTFTNGPLQIQAMGSGDLDFGYIGPGAFWLPASGAAKFISLNTIGNADRVIVRKDSGITSMAQLKGKEVAFPAGTSGEQILDLALEAAGMTKADITPVIMDPSTLVAAFSSGKIVAAGIWYPNVEVIKNSVEIVELAGNADFEDKMAFPNAFVASNSVVEEYPEIVSIVQSVLKEANDYRYNNLDKTIELVAKQLALEVDVVKKDAGNAKYLSTAELEAIVTDGTLVKWLDALNATFVKAKRFDKAPDAASTFLVDSYLAAKVAE
jgi:NitT/TauT family transport system substrate-binding protein